MEGAILRREEEIKREKAINKGEKMMAWRETDERAEELMGRKIFGRKERNDQEG